MIFNRNNYFYSIILKYSYCVTSPEMLHTCKKYKQFTRLIIIITVSPHIDYVIRVNWKYWFLIIQQPFELRTSNIKLFRFNFVGQFPTNNNKMLLSNMMTIYLKQSQYQEIFTRANAVVSKCWARKKYILFRIKQICWCARESVSRVSIYPVVLYMDLYMYISFLHSLLLLLFSFAPLPVPFHFKD